MTQGRPPYPVQFSVDYPEKPLDRLSTFFRLIAIIPIGIVLSILGSTLISTSEAGVTVISTGGIICFAPLLLILFRQKYPRWWFDWNVALVKFQNRVGAYFLLLRDEYPSTDEEQAVHVEIAYPDVPNDLNRWLPLIKWLLAIPHYIVLAFLTIGVVVVVIIAWFAIMITGNYPRGLFNFVVGVMRWGLRVAAYAFLLTTDRYPPFSLEP